MGFWRRFVAALIDSLITSIVVVVVLSVTGLGTIAQLDPEHITPEAMRKMAAGGLASVLIAVGFWIVYFAGFESSSRQATPRKMALGIFVAGESGQRLGFGQALARNAAKSVSSAILSIGFLMAAFTARKQALHDIMTDCLVLRR